MYLIRKGAEKLNNLVEFAKSALVIVDIFFVIYLIGIKKKKLNNKII